MKIPLVWNAKIPVRVNRSTTLPYANESIPPAVCSLVAYMLVFIPIYVRVSNVVSFLQVSHKN
jgi:hypothetical protein